MISGDSEVKSWLLPAVLRSGEAAKGCPSQVTVPGSGIEKNDSVALCISNIVLHANLVYSYMIVLGRYFSAPFSTNSTVFEGDFVAVFKNT